MTKILIVEDQKWTLMGLQQAVEEVMPAYFAGFSGKDYDVAKWYSRAEELIGEKAYDFVFLDHRMPYNDVGDLEDKDMRKFSASLINRGYDLVGPIKEKNPKAIVIGTSSLKNLRTKPAPDFTLDKSRAEEDLGKIMKEIRGIV